MSPGGHEATGFEGCWSFEGALTARHRHLRGLEHTDRLSYHRISSAPVLDRQPSSPELSYYHPAQIALSAIRSRNGLWPLRSEPNVISWPWITFSSPYPLGNHNHSNTGCLFHWWQSSVLAWPQKRDVCRCKGREMRRSYIILQPASEISVKLP